MLFDWLILHFPIDLVLLIRESRQLLVVLDLFVFKFLHLPIEGAHDHIKLSLLILRFLYPLLQLGYLLFIVFFFALKVEGSIILEGIFTLLVVVFHNLVDVFKVLHESVSHIVGTDPQSLPSDQTHPLIQEITHFLLLFFLQVSTACLHLGRKRPLPLLHHLHHLLLRI